MVLKKIKHLQIGGGSCQTPADWISQLDGNPCNYQQKKGSMEEVEKRSRIAAKPAKGRFEV